MAASLLYRNKLLFRLDIVNKAGIVKALTFKRSIMSSRANLEKALDGLKTNPFFDKYAQKIAKLQNTDPEEFLERVQEKERKAKEEKVLSRCLNSTKQPFCSSSKMSHLWRSSMRTNRTISRSYSSVPTVTKYVTTPIFYVNAAPHIGHLYTAVLADTIARFYKMQNVTSLLSSGTDEHGNKVERAAKAFKLSPAEYCATISQKFQQMCDVFGVDCSRFVRTTEPAHVEAVQYFWKLLEEKDFIYKGKYSGWYCTSDEAFLSNQDLVEKKSSTGEIIKVSAESGHPVEWAEEDTYKFRLSEFQDDLKYWLKREDVVKPAVFHKILSQWVEDGSCMEDLSISRPASRVSWGIPTPNDPKQTIYVWLDALVSYLTSLGYPDEKFRKFWPPAVQVIGKDILKFHGIYWPAFLLAAGLEPPKNLFCHSHWTVNDEKMSKSRGNVVSPFDAAELFSTEGIRYFLLRDSVPHNDADYSTERVQNILNSELADTLGNLVSRCTGKVINPHNELPAAIFGAALQSESAKTLRANMESLGDTAKSHYESFYIHHAVDAAMATLRSANAMVEHHKPWALKKEAGNEEAAAELKAVLALAMEAVRVSALALYPVVPVISGNLLDFFNVPASARSWSDVRPLYFDSSREESGHFGSERVMVFPKIKASA